MDKKLHRGRVVTDDPVLFEETSKPWEVLSEPLARHGFENTKAFVATTDVVLYREHFASPTRLRGVSPSGMLIVGVPLRTGSKTRYWGRAPQRSAVPIASPGALDAVVDGGDEHFMIMMDLDFLRRSLSEPSFDLLETAAGRRALGVKPAALASLVRWLDAVLARAEQRLGAAQEAVIADLLEQELPKRLLDAYAGPGQRLRPNVGGSRRVAVDRALEYLLCSGESMPTIAELCEAAGVKQRTLEYAFQDGFGITPVRFIRLHRLHLARLELAKAVPDSIKVSDVARGLGFFHLSRFAGEYKRLFGELPSQTLARDVHPTFETPRILPPGASNKTGGPLEIGMVGGPFA